MSDTNKRIRVFVGSPRDVAEERDAVSDVIERLNSKFDRDGVGLHFQPIRWERYLHLRDTRFTPQAAIASGIPRPRDCEVAVFIFWRRLGTVLDMTGLEPNGAGARPTGSTWDFYDALESAKTKVLTYRKMAPAPAVRDESSAQFEERQRQELEVHRFFASFRDSEGSFKHNWHNFETIAEFKADLRGQLGIIARKALSETEAPGGKSKGQDIDKPTPTVNPPAQRDTKKTVKPPVTRWPRWLIYGATEAPGGKSEGRDIGKPTPTVNPPAQPKAEASPAASTTYPGGFPRAGMPRRSQLELNVFLCHSSGDKPAVRELYEKLRKEEGIKPWLDEEDLLAGQDWDSEIRKAMRKAHVVLVCLSRGSIDRAGYVQKEIKHALAIAAEQPDDTIFLIPLKLEQCDIPECLRRWHWVSLYEDEERGYERLIRALHAREKSLKVILDK